MKTAVVSPPARFGLFSVNGQWLFPVYGASGGLRAEAISYLLTVREGRTYRSTLRFTLAEMDGGMEERAFRDKVEEALKTREPFKDGEDMGR